MWHVPATSPDTGQQNHLKVYRNSETLSFKSEINNKDISQFCLHLIFVLK